MKRKNLIIKAIRVLLKDPDFDSSPTNLALTFGVSLDSIYRHLREIKKIENYEQTK